MIDGLEADVVTLALAGDVDQLAKKGGLIPADWQKRLPQNSSPLHLDHRVPGAQGQPQGHQGLVRPCQGRRRRNPRPTRRRRAARGWNYLAAWGYALKQPGGSDDTAKELVGKIYKNTKVLDTGARGSTTTFVERGSAMC